MPCSCHRRVRRGHRIVSRNFFANNITSTNSISDTSTDSNSTDQINENIEAQ